MRKFTIDVFNLLRRRRSKTRVTKFFISVYKERLKKRLTLHYSMKNRRRFIRLKRLRKALGLNKYYGFFEYSTAPMYLDKEQHKLSFHGYWLWQYKLFTNFYNNVSIRVFRRLFVRARKARVVLFNHFLTLLESRIDSLLIRLNWVYSKHQIRQLLRQKWFLVNGARIMYTNYLLSGFQCLSVRSRYKKQIFEKMFHRIRKRLFFHRTPYYLEVNFRTLTCILIPHFVTRNYVKHPFRIRCDSLLYLTYAKR